MAYYSQKDASKCKCLDCGKIRMVKKIEWGRVARPYCYVCGGVVEICTTAGRDAQLKAMDAARIQHERRQKKMESK